MASVHSPIRTIIKPILYKLFPKSLYRLLQTKAKIRDIKFCLVEESEMVLLPHFVKENTEVVDIGANYAYYSERLSKIVGKKGRVYAFEPIPFTFQIAANIIKKLNLSNVSLFQKGVGDENKKVSFRVPKQDFGAISAGQSHIATRNNNFKEKEQLYNFSKEELINCEIITLDSFLLDTITQVSFIKIDIEGAEYFALKGMKKIIEKFYPSLLIEIQTQFIEGFGLKVDELLNLIRIEYGYLIFQYDTQKEKLVLYNGPIWDGNFILIHSSKKDDFSHLL